MRSLSAGALGGADVDLLRLDVVKMTGADAQCGEADEYGQDRGAPAQQQRRITGTVGGGRVSTVPRGDTDN